MNGRCHAFDANIGGNKADLFVGRRFDLVARVGADGQVEDTLTLTYSNRAQSSPDLASLVAQYGGEYRDYVRVYVPETASLRSLTLRQGGASRPLSPESVDAWRSYGAAMLATSQLKRSKMAIMRAIRIDPNNASLHELMSEIYLREGTARLSREEKLRASDLLNGASAK